MFSHSDVPNLCRYIHQSYLPWFLPLSKATLTPADASAASLWYPHPSISSPPSCQSVTSLGVSVSKLRKDTPACFCTCLYTRKTAGPHNTVKCHTNSDSYLNTNMHRYSRTRCIPPYWVGNAGRLASWYLRLAEAVGVSLQSSACCLLSRGSRPGCLSSATIFHVRNY